MFEKTDNPYKFQYLQTGIKGEGIPYVYLPDLPSKVDILFPEEQKWTRPKMSKDMRKMALLWYRKMDPESSEYDPNYICPLGNEISDWIDREWDRQENGAWFWNNGVATYITGFYYAYLTIWEPYFGNPDYRETDKEITYLLQYCEEDPDSFGLLLNTIRRYGKSAMMGFWLIYRTIRNRKHRSGMQGENDDKITKFYTEHILDPFRKIDPWWMPTYDTSSQQSSGINFNLPARQLNKMRTEERDEPLESSMDYRVSKESAYDQAVLHSYVMEEPGKTLVANVSDRWDFVKPCLKRGVFVRGKAFLGTTVEFMDVTNRGGKAYKRIFYESDFNDRQQDGKTISGLYASFLPADCAYEGFFDEWGHPKREEARRQILLERKSVEKDPIKLASLIRKYPLYIREIFYVSSGTCEFNITILQNRKSELDMMVNPPWSRFDLKWENNVAPPAKGAPPPIQVPKVIPVHNPSQGWYKASQIPAKEEMNLISSKLIGGVSKYFPTGKKFESGLDPIDHGVVIENTINAADEFVSSRRSRPVQLVKRLYDSKLDGVITEEEIKLRAQPGRMLNGIWTLDDTGKPYQYNSNRYIGMMDIRPNDPNVLAERVLMICWLHGLALHVESQKRAVINYFYDRNCELFIKNKYIPVDSTARQQSSFNDGTAASQPIIQEYTGLLSTYIEYFGHTLDFDDLIDDLIMFSPRKTTEHDYSVSMGFTELSEKIRPKVNKPDIINLDQFYRPNPVW